MTPVAPELDWVGPWRLDGFSGYWERPFYDPAASTIVWYEGPKAASTPLKVNWLDWLIYAWERLMLRLRYLRGGSGR